MEPLVNFLNACVEYFDNRVRTGKFAGDIKAVSKEMQNGTVSGVTEAGKSAAKTGPAKSTVTTVQKISKFLLAIPLIGLLIQVLADTVRLVIKFYAEFFITFALTFPTSILLLNFFETSTPLFFLGFLPILFYNALCISALYLCIAKRDSGEHLSLWKSMQLTAKQIGPLIFAVFSHLSIVLLTIICFSILVMFFGFFFDAMGIVWSSSFIYWFFVILVGLIVLIGLFVVTLIMHQAYFLTIIEKQQLHHAFKNGWKIIQTAPYQIFFLYLLLTIYCILLISWAGLYYLYLGIAICLFVFIHLSVFLGLLVRRRFKIKLEQTTTAHETHLPIFIIIVIFGVINYILAGIMVTRQYDHVTALIEEQRANYFLTKELKSYINAIYRYTISYPQNWTIYERKDNTVTFYNNYTGTTSGGIWLNITVRPYNDQEFQRLYQIRPGLVSLETDTQNITTKVSNLSIDGHEGVSYTYFKQAEPYPEYQTHYLIKKDDYVYDVAFTTLSKNIEGYNDNLFEKIINSFRFIK